MGDEDEPEPRRIYLSRLIQMKDDEVTTLYVDFNHLLASASVLARAVEEQYYR